MAIYQQGSVVVEGKHADAFPLPDGRRITGQGLWRRADWPWRDGLQRPRRSSVWMTATSLTDGPVTVVVIDEPSQARYDLLGRATRLTASHLIRAWKRRSWIEQHCRLRKHVLAVEACQVYREDAYDGHMVLRLLAGLALLYTTRILCKGHVTMEEIVFSLQHHWRFLNAKNLEFHGLSWDLDLEAA